MKSGGKVRGPRNKSKPNYMRETSMNLLTGVYRSKRRLVKRTINLKNGFGGSGFREQNSNVQKFLTKWTHIPSRVYGPSFGTSFLFSYRDFLNTVVN